MTTRGLTTTATMTLDTPGWWQVRVRGKNLADLDDEPEYSVGAYSVNVVYKSSPKRPALPIVSKTFTTRGAVISTKADRDDFNFEGYPGQTISATVTKPRSSTLFPGLELYRPDGTKVEGGTTFDGKKATIATTATATSAGTWRVRVYGVDTSPVPDPKAPKNTTGAYTLNVKLGKPTAKPSIQPDVNGQYRFTIPATEGAVIGYTLAYKGSPPVFNSFVNPNGQGVPGVSQLKVLSFTIPPSQPFGYYTLTFDAPTPAPTDVTFTSRVTPPSSGKPIRRTLSSVEPVIVVNGVSPTSGGQANETALIVTTTGNLVDPSVDDPALINLFVDHVPLEDVTTIGSTVRGTVPANKFTLGLHDVVVRTTSGQVAVADDAFEIVPPPLAAAIDPSVGSIAGGYPMTITGVGFSKLVDPRIVIGDLRTIVPVNITSVTDTEIKFVAPNYGAAGKTTFGVVDAPNGNGDLCPLNSFEFVSSPAISRLVPSLTTILGGDLISVNGANFQDTDHVYLERSPGSNTYDEMTKTTVDSTMHQFTAPVKPKGAYNVYVTDQFGQPLPPRVRKLTYFQFADLSATTATMFPSGADLWDAASVVVSDFDKDGIDDLILSRVGAGLSSTSHTRVLRNNDEARPGVGRFTDVTIDVMPPATTNDDWRADRIFTGDVNLDGYPDLFLVTNDSTVLPSTRSHTRILVNEPLTGSTPNSPRVFRDRTTTLFPGPRGNNYDNWRGLDMWVGDIDKGPPAPPEILIVHKDMKQELDVTCAPYCSSPTAGGYTYGFYWGGGRGFFWDKNANGGLGKYKFARNFFPRKSGLRVPVVVPGGGTIPICNGQQYGQPCINRFTPFIGKRITAGDLNADGKPDVAVLSNEVVQRIYPPSSSLVTISSLQVGINKFNPVDGAEITDVTALLTALGGDFKGDAVEIGGIGYPDGNSFGSLVMAKSTPVGGGLAIRLIKYKPGAAPATPYDFEDITSFALPAPPGADLWEASKFLFKDLDSDGDQDLALVCPVPPGGTGPAFRILRNDIVAAKAGILTTALMPLLQNPHLPLSANEHYEADFMAIGDMNDDDAHDFVLVRANTTAPSPETRILITAKQ
jgi:hypothetical protein